MKSIAITVPADEVDIVNAELSIRGYGENNISVPMKNGVIFEPDPELENNPEPDLPPPNPFEPEPEPEPEPETETPTHFSAHWWVDDAVYEELLSLKDTVLANSAINVSENLSTPTGVFGAANGDYVKVFHKEFSPGQWGWRAEFVVQASEFEPGVRAIAIYADPEHTQYLYTTGAFSLDNGVWATEWNAGAGNPQDIHWALLWASVIEYKSTLTSTSDNDIGWLRQGIPGGEPIGEDQPPTRWISGGGTGVAGTFNENDRVIHDRPSDGGADWIFSSNIDSNSNEPGRDGQLDRWWTPVERLEALEPDPDDDPLPDAWVSAGGTGISGSYLMDVMVTHDRPQDNGNIWVFKSKLPANTTEPSRDSTFDRWWEPLGPATDWPFTP